MTEFQTSMTGVTGFRTDPVCGMSVRPARKNLVALYSGRSYWFCAESCLSAFESNPRRYLALGKRERERVWRRQHATDNDTTRVGEIEPL
jgi:YHS domain-containing protein